jgi:hypothetical protein
MAVSKRSRSSDRIPLSGPGQVEASLASHCPNDWPPEEEEGAEDNEVCFPGCVAETEE